jgi:hypothetical protein
MVLLFCITGMTPKHDVVMESDRGATPLGSMKLRSRAAKREESDAAVRVTLYVSRHMCFAKGVGCLYMFIVYLDCAGDDC